MEALRICHVSPRLPPEQASSALLPAHLGQWAITAGHEVSFVSHPPRSGKGAPIIPATLIPSRHRDARVLGSMRLASLLETARIQRDVAPVIDRADIVHVHGSGLLSEVTGLLAVRKCKAVVLTLYGREIWNYRKRPGVDLFTRLYERATRIVFYSRGLMDDALARGLERPGLSSIYPPLAEAFSFVAADQQAGLRAHLGIDADRVLVNVKRLHASSGQRDLIAAMPAILTEYPGAHLVICGTGSLGRELSLQAEGLGIASRVTFTGLIPPTRIAQYVAASDVFVLPSLAEAMPVSALEALAAGTPVVTADSSGGVELSGLFGPDVTVVPREKPEALAKAAIARLAAPRRTLPDTATTLAAFRPAVVVARYLEVYRHALDDVAQR